MQKAPRRFPEGSQKVPRRLQKLRRRPQKAPGSLLITHTEKARRGTREKPKTTRKDRNGPENTRTGNDWNATGTRPERQARKGPETHSGPRPGRPERDRNGQTRRTGIRPEHLYLVFGDLGLALAGARRRNRSETDRFHQNLFYEECTLAFRKV